MTVISNKPGHPEEPALNSPLLENETYFKLLGVLFDE
jgi:hypothetical protein